MTTADAARALRERAELRGITAARSQEEFDDDDRLIDLYLACPRCATMHLPSRVRARVIRQGRDFGHVTALARVWYLAAHGDREPTGQGGPRTSDTRGI